MDKIDDEAYFVITSPRGPSNKKPVGPRIGPLPVGIVCYFLIGLELKKATLIEFEWL
jgi:hypothetical protein